MFVDDKKHGESLVELEPWRDLLLRAADLLDNDGWCKYTYAYEVNGKERYCAIGAIWKADGWNGDMWEYHSLSSVAEIAFTRLVNHLSKATGRRVTYYSVPNWNDSRADVKEITSELRTVAGA